MRQFVKFFLVGLLNTAIDWGLFFVLTSWGFVALPVAQCVSYWAGVGNSWFWNSKWVFKRRVGSEVSAPPTRGMLRFFVVTLTTTAITASLIAVLHDVFAVPLWWGKLLVTIVGVAATFACYRLWVFLPAASAPVSPRP